jgi:ketosteroid isomerase-like protein
VSQENVQIVRELYAAMARRDEDFIYARYHEDIEWHDHQWLDVGEHRGLDGVMRVWRQFLAEFELAHFEGREFIDCGESVVVDTVMRARGRASGVAVDQEVFPMWTLRDGKVSRVDVFRTRAEADAASA